MKYFFSVSSYFLPYSITQSPWVAYSDAMAQFGHTTQHVVTSFLDLGGSFYNAVSMLITHFLLLTFSTESQGDGQMLNQLMHRNKPIPGASLYFSVENRLHFPLFLGY